jgi:hypothetical protein
MFSQTWKKYLPVIIILLKRSSAGDQVLDMNSSDFTRAAGGRKARLSFSNVHLREGRLTALTDTPTIASQLVLVLQENDISKKIIRNSNFEFALNSDFQLTIKNNSVPAAVEESKDQIVDMQEKSPAQK